MRMKLRKNAIKAALSAALVMIPAFHVHMLRLVSRLQEKLASGEKGKNATKI